MDATIDCRLGCDVPSGADLREVPMPRHDWGDVIVCPNEDCGKAFLVVKNPHEPRAASPSETDHREDA